MQKIRQFKLNSYTLVLFVFSFQIILLNGQPQPCSVSDPEMTPTCAEACIICDIDGFEGRHESIIVGSLPDDFCTLNVHNAQWIAFQAASVDLSIELSVSNCEQNRGLELAIYRSLDCENFTMISNCFGGANRNSISEGESGIIENTEPLVIGQFYYLAMDGGLGDNCDWQFNVIEGSTAVDQLTTTSPIEGETIICPNQTQTYTTLPEVGAVLFEWTLDGQSIGDETLPQVDLILEQIGAYDLCVTALNACDRAIRTCQVIEVVEIPPTEIGSIICEGECFEIEGNSFCESDIYEITITLENGCDSIIILELVKLEQPINNLELNICEGDTIFIGLSPYFITGQYSDTLLNQTFCDSIINLNLTVIDCEVQSEFIINDVICNGESNGLIEFLITVGNPPFRYNWQHLQSSIIGSGDISDLNETVAIGSLPTGEIVIEIVDALGFADVIIATIEEPFAISIDVEMSNFNQFNISCNGLSDGFINIAPSGGQEPYSLNWSNGVSGFSNPDLEAGNYIITVTDNLDCNFIQEFEMMEPSIVNSNVVFSNPNCSGLESGMIEIDSTSGGIPPYLYSIDGNEFIEASFFQDLGPGVYDVKTMDSNLCLNENSGELIAPEIPILSGDNFFSINLGCEVSLNVEVNNITIRDVEWSNSEILSCDNCLDPIAIPLDSKMQTVIVISQDDCADTLGLFFDVKKNREFFAPNVFTPNSEESNARFIIYGGKEVLEIDLSIYDRWGNKVFESFGIMPDDSSQGWDGQLKNKLVNSGVYLWKANILFIDGYSEIFAGDVTLLR